MTTPASVPESNTPLGYRPVSGYAIAGFGLGAVFAAGLLIAAGIAFVTGVPLILSDFIYVIPIAAAGLSLAGWIHVQRSEGTRAGLSMARWGLVLSISCGLGYLTWKVAKGLAVEQEAGTFADAWLKNLQTSGQDPLALYIAYWDTLPLEMREKPIDLHNPRFKEALRAKPAELARLREFIARRYFQEKGNFPEFLNKELVQLLRQQGTQARVESSGVIDWDYLPGSPGGYRVFPHYAIKTLEFEMDVVVGVQSAVDPDGVRKWQVFLEDTGFTENGRPQLTVFGAFMSDYRRESRHFAMEWFGKLAAGKNQEVFLETLAPPQRGRAGLKDAGLATGSLSIPALASLALPATDLPGHADFQAGKLVSQAGAADSRHPAVAAIRLLFKGRSPQFRLDNPKTAYLCPWEIQGNELRFSQPFTLLIPPQAINPGPYLPVAGTLGAAGPIRVLTFPPLPATVVVALDDALVVKKIQQAKTGQIPGVTGALATRGRWRVVRVEVHLEGVPDLLKQN